MSHVVLANSLEQRLKHSLIGSPIGISPPFQRAAIPTVPHSDSQLVD